MILFLVYQKKDYFRLYNDGMFDVEVIVQSGGLLAVGLIVFAESGLLLGFFLPGDTLLLAAGFFAGQGLLPIGWLLAVIIGAAIVGYQVGYLVGERAGPRVFRRQEGLLFRAEYIARTERFFARHGGKTVVMARFVPYLRTFVSTVAGVGRMNKPRYLLYNIAGALLWGGGVTLLGYWLGNSLPHVDTYLVPMLAGVFALTFVAAAYHLLKSGPRRRQLFSQLRNDVRHLRKALKQSPGGPTP